MSAGHTIILTGLNACFGIFYLSVFFAWRITRTSRVECVFYWYSYRDQREFVMWLSSRFCCYSDLAPISNRYQKTGSALFSLCIDFRNICVLTVSPLMSWLTNWRSSKKHLQTWRARTVLVLFLSSMIYYRQFRHKNTSDLIWRKILKIGLLTYQYIFSFPNGHCVVFDV